VELTRRALQLDPEYVEALEHLGTVLVTRRARYGEGLALVERAVSLRRDDAGLWYSLGWCYEFAAHEIRRRLTREPLNASDLYERAAEAFRTCLSLHPEGKLAGDAEDLLDHVENELRSL
jgi:tetratricopeptide (TPR) repeat protein